MALLGRLQAHLIELFDPRVLGDRGAGHRVHRAAVCQLVVGDVLGRRLLGRRGRGCHCEAGHRGKAGRKGERYDGSGETHGLSPQATRAAKRRPAAAITDKPRPGWVLAINRVGETGRDGLREFGC